MAVIANDCPAQEKASPADVTVVAPELPAQEEGFSIDKSKKVFQPFNTDQDSDTESLPPQEIPPEPSSLLSVKKRGKKKRKRKHKKKIKTMVIKVTKGARSKPGHFSGKFLLKLPKKAIGNRIFFVALCAVLQYHLAQSALICMKTVPAPDAPVYLKHNGQNYIFQKRTFCPDKIPIFASCSVCHKNESLLEIVCSNAAALEIWVKDENGNEDKILARMTSEDCNHFVKKRREHRRKRSGPSPDLKVSETSVEEKQEDGRNSRNDDEEICNIRVPVTDFPIVIRLDDHHYTFHEAKLCPTRTDVLKICSVCFIHRSLLDMSCRRNADGDNVVLWVEHGKGRGASSHVEMTSEVCHKIVMNASKRQGSQSDGGTSSENTEGNTGTSWRGSGVFVIPLYIFVLLYLWI